MEEKKDCLSKLYFLRAALSKISNNLGECDGIDEKIKSILERKFTPSIPSEIFESKDAHLNKHDNEIKELETNVQELNDKEAELKNKITTLEKNYDKANRPYKFSDSLGLVFLEIFLAAIIFFLMRWWLNVDRSFWVGLISFPVSLASLVLAIGSIFASTPKERERDLERMKKEIQKEHEKLIQINDSKCALQEKISEIENDKTQIEQRIAKFQNSADEIIKKEYEKFCQSNKLEKKSLLQSKEAFTEEANVIYDFIKATSIIDERDWKNLDVIIYEIETGRADNMKEALQQADMYVRHDEIMDAMETATAAICSTIKESIAELSRSIGKSLSSLRLELKGLRSDVSDLRSDIFEISKANSEMSERFDSLVNAQELSNALLKKANTSSEHLAEDIRRMRLIRDEEYYRK